MWFPARLQCTGISDSVKVKLTWIAPGATTYTQYNLLKKATNVHASNTFVYHAFLSRVSTLTRDIDIANLSVRLSVRPSARNVPVSDENGLTYRHSFSPYGSPIILVLPASNIITKFRRGHPLQGAKYRWGRKNSRFSTNKSLYLANNTKYRHSYYGRWIGTRMRSIKWCHFQWPWTNPNPVFKVTPLFHAKCLTNGYRYDYSYYRRRIGNRTQAFEWHPLQWPWVTSNPDFKVTILFNVK